MFVQIHIVQKGETLWRIAKQYGIGLDELKSLNTHLANPDYIVPGMEIILPDHHGGTANKSNMTKEQQTAPMPTKQQQTAPMPTKQQQTAPMPTKQQQTAPKEQMTKPVKEVPKVVETAPIPQPMPMPQPVPMPMPQPHIDLTQLQFDFTPHLQFEQQMPAPAPMPMPMPQPQPIYIQVPVPQPETKVETKVEKEVEYIQVPVPQPQPQIVYVPYFVKQHCHKPHPCGCHEKAHRHHKRCGCHEQQMYHHNPCGCHEQPFYDHFPYGFNEYDYQQMPMQDYQQMPMQDYQQMPMQDYDCGCGKGGYSQDMMPYGLPYFEPNYDMAPMTGVAPAMEELHEDHDHDGLPDWLLDSSEVKTKAMEQHADPQGFEEYNHDHDGGQVANEYQEGFNYGSAAYPYAQDYYGPYNMQGNPEFMQQMMPYQMMPQQMMQPNCQGYPYNPYFAQNKPWNY